MNNPEFGECRARAPQVRSDPGLLGAFPLVTPATWCGEWIEIGASKALHDRRDAA